MKSYKLYMKCLYYNFETLFNKLGYAYFKQGEYNLNIIGVRADKGRKVTNMYDDYIVVIYTTPTGRVNRAIYEVTTEPGRYYMVTKPCNPKGTAILVPGQYRGCWQIGLHKGKYVALCQKKSVSVYRDGNRDEIYDLNPKTIETGIFGINIHRSSEYSNTKLIDKYSAGCQVFCNPADFKAFMRLCEKQKERYGNSFTYTLLDEKQLV